MRRRLKWELCRIFAVCFAIIAVSAEAAIEVIDFESPLLLGEVLQHEETIPIGNFNVKALGNNGAAQIILPAEGFRGPNSGTAYLQSSKFSEIELTTLNSTSFDLVSLDIAEFSEFITTNSVEISGYFEGQLQASLDISIDQIVDGIGGLADFQSINFGQEWEGLTRIIFEAEAFSIDNIALNFPSVPIPLPPALFLFALVLPILKTSILSRPLQS